MHNEFPFQCKVTPSQTWPTSKVELPRMIEDSELRQALKRLEGKFHFFSMILVLFCWAVTSNCVTQQVTAPTALIDLNSAYSVKEIEKLKLEL